MPAFGSHAGSPFGGAYDPASPSNLMLQYEMQQQHVAQARATHAIEIAQREFAQRASAGAPFPPPMPFACSESRPSTSGQPF